MVQKVITEEDIPGLIRSDRWMMEVLEAARTLDLPDWMIGAGFVRNRVWDYLHGFVNETVPTNDIDLIYYDPDCVDEAVEKEHDKRLSGLMDVEWSVKNQARMHLNYNPDCPYQSSEHALSHWIETATCVAVRLEDDDSLRFIAPHGIDDLVNLVLRPTPFGMSRLEVFHERVRSKGWLQCWDKLRVVDYS